MSKVAKPEDREWIRNDSRFDELLDVAYGVLRDMEPRGLASTINGLAKLDYNPGNKAQIPRVNDQLARRHLVPAPMLLTGKRVPIP